MSDSWVTWKVWHSNGEYVLQCLQGFSIFTFHSQSSDGQENFMKTKILRKYLLCFIDQWASPLSPPPFLSSDVDHIRLVHVTNWSSRCPWPLSPNSPASQSSDVLLGTTLGTDFVISCSKVNISVSLIICVNISAETIATGFAECNLYESMASPIQKNSSST